MNKAKKIKSDNFAMGNRGKSNIDIAILKKIIIGWYQIILHFWGTNNIFADCIHTRFGEVLTPYESLIYLPLLAMF